MLLLEPDSGAVAEANQDGILVVTLTMGPNLVTDITKP